MKSIEVISFQEVKAIDHLAEATWANEEPGFQIDGVTSFDELETVFAALRGAGKSEFGRPKFASSYPHDGDFSEMIDHYTSAPHIDATGEGLAVHHEISRGKIPLELAVLRGGSGGHKYREKPKIIEWKSANLKHQRKGETKQGRLTVFSQGDAHELLPTVHLFERWKTMGIEYARYAQGHRESGHISVPKLASKAFQRIRTMDPGHHPRRYPLYQTMRYF
jgi:hypothetical protein